MLKQIFVRLKCTLYLYLTPRKDVHMGLLRKEFYSTTKQSCWNDMFPYMDNPIKMPVVVIRYLDFDDTLELQVVIATSKAEIIWHKDSYHFLSSASKFFTNISLSLSAFQAASLSPLDNGFLFCLAATILRYVSRTW